MPAPIRLMVFEGYQPGYGFFNSFGALQRPLLQAGSRDPAVKELQTLLQNALQMSIGVTGVFDDRTKSAVLQFQRAKGLSADGIVGPQTWSALLAQPVDVPGATGPGPKIPGTTGTGGATGSGGSVGPDISIEKATAKSNYGMILGGVVVVGALAWFLTRK